MRAGRLGAPRPRRATSPASRPRRTIGTRRPAGRAARSRDSGRQRAPGTLASSRRPARSPRMANCSRSTCGRSGRLGRGRPFPAARYVERRAGTHAIERSSSYGRASTRSTAGRDTRAARRRAAARLRRVSSVSRFARLRISQFQRKHTGRRDGYAWVARRSSQGSLRPHVSRVACRVSHGATSPEHDRQAATAGRDCRDERASSPNAALRVRKAVERAPDCRRQLREVAGEHEPGWPAGVSGRSRVNTGGGRVPVVGTPASGEVAIAITVSDSRKPAAPDRSAGRWTWTAAAGVGPRRRIAPAGARTQGVLVNALAADARRSAASASFRRSGFTARPSTPAAAAAHTALVYSSQTSRCAVRRSENFRRLAVPSAMACGPLSGRVVKGSATA